MARVIPRSGRREANRPVFSREELRGVVRRVLEREGVRFGGGGKSFEDQCWRLFRVFQFLVPAVVVASGLPVSLYGLGSCRLVSAGSGHKLRFRFSRSVLGSALKQVKVLGELPGRGAMLNRFWRALDLFLAQERGAGSPLGADCFSLDFDD